ncbi:MAG: hypothetical protein HW403_948 [Dehalococcoidia bacterium]|nr:hypothetical protein [Dehalococcoidia bacterium]
MMIRVLFPTDLVALVPFERKATTNEAVTKYALGKGDGNPFPMGAALEQWLFLEGNRHTWVAVSGLAMHGLISARQRSGPSAWEVDCLLLDTQGYNDDTSLQLLLHLADTGAERVFLRLPIESPLVGVARKAGFRPLLQEQLFSLKNPALICQPGWDKVEGLRPRVKADDYPLFRLYNISTPDEVRVAWGMSLKEWREAQDVGLTRSREYVCEREGQVRAWLRVAQDGDTGQFELMTLPDVEEAITESLLHFALSKMEKRATVMCLIPQFQTRLKALLTEHNFELCQNEYCTLVKQLAVRVRQSSLAPARA